MDNLATFVYYYFLGRKYGHKPVVCAMWAKAFCIWWDTDTNARGQAPQI